MYTCIHTKFQIHRFPMTLPSSQYQLVAKPNLDDKKEENNYDIDNPIFVRYFAC